MEEQTLMAGAPLAVHPPSVGGDAGGSLLQLNGPQVAPFGLVGCGHTSVSVGRDHDRRV